MRILLDSSIGETVENYVNVYTQESGEAISEGMVSMVIDLLVQKYISIKSYPSNWSQEDIKADVNEYFESHAARIALKIPEIVGRIGAEGETSHSENGINRSYQHGDVLYDAFPDVVQFAHVL